MSQPCTEDMPSSTVLFWLPTVPTAYAAPDVPLQGEASVPAVMREKLPHATVLSAEHPLMANAVPVDSCVSDGGGGGVGGLGAHVLYRMRPFQPRGVVHATCWSHGASKARPSNTVSAASEANALNAPLIATPVEDVPVA